MVADLAVREVRHENGARRALLILRNGSSSEFRRTVTCNPRGRFLLRYRKRCFAGRIRDGMLTEFNRLEPRRSRTDRGGKNWSHRRSA